MSNFEDAVIQRIKQLEREVERLQKWERAADLGLGKLTDPNADRVLFWDDSAGALKWLTLGTGLTITDTTIKPVQSSAKLTRTSNMTIAHNTETIVQWTDESWDTDSYANLVTDNTKLIAPRAGIYSVYAAMDFDANDTGIRAIHLLLNGSLISQGAFNNLGTSRTTVFLPAQEYKLNANDYLQVRVLQRSGVSLDINIDFNTPCFGITYVGSLS